MHPDLIWHFAWHLLWAELCLGGSDDALRLVPVSKFSLEGCLEFLAPDELLEVTPENLRIRKRILDHDLRMKAASKKNK